MHSDQLAKKKSPNQSLSDIDIERKFIASARDSVAASVDDDWKPPPPPLPVAGDKLHRRNPIAVRQEIQSYDNLIPETGLVGVELHEMPGLQNTEQWKRIAARVGQTSPPISRRYFQQSTNVLNTFDETVVDTTHSRIGNYTITRSSTASLTFKKSHRRLVFGSLLLMCIVASAIAIVTAVIIVRKDDDKTTDWYSGSIYVQARFDAELLKLTSTLVKNYQREFCNLVATTLADMKTKYAVFYTDCSVQSFRNGSIIGDFRLGFSRYQNVTRLNSFLNRTLVNRQLFGGTIQTINFNATASSQPDDNDYNSEDYDDSSNQPATIEHVY